MSEVNLDIWKLSLETKLLQVLSQIGELPAEGAWIRTTFGSREVAVHLAPVKPTKPKYIPRTECERDCLQVLKEASQPMIRQAIRDALEKAGNLWGESTVAQTLANLVADGVLENYRKKGGYYLPEEES